MSPRVSIQIFEQFDGTVSAEWIRAVAEAALSIEPEWAAQRLSVVIADDHTVSELNRVHRGLDQTTDVLSFSNSHSGHYYGESNDSRAGIKNAEFALPPGYDAGLGEVIISLGQVERQASEAGHSRQKELAIMLAHGILHLLGYDHELDTEAAEMFSLQDRVIANLDCYLQT